MGKELGNGEQPQDKWGSRRGLSLGALKRGFMDHLRFSQGRIPRIATLNDEYTALAYTVKDRLLHRWILSAGASSLTLYHLLTLREFFVYKIKVLPSLSLTYVYTESHR